MLKNQRGLTLIELLAVIVILGIIAAIAVPSIGNIIDNSRDKATVSEAIQTLDAAKIAKAENPETDTFDEGTLVDYLDKVKAESFEVEYGENGFIISGHDAVNIVNGEEADSMLKKMLKNQRGLTLIEFHAVIGILGIIAAIAVLSIGNIIDNSRDKATVSKTEEELIAHIDGD